MLRKTAHMHTHLLLATFKISRLVSRDVGLTVAVFYLAAARHNCSFIYPENKELVSSPVKSFRITSGLCCLCLLHNSLFLLHLSKLKLLSS
jgi:hypothetical protein